MHKSLRYIIQIYSRGRRGHDRMIVGFTTTYASSAYHHLSCMFESRSWRGVLHTTLCDKVCERLAAGTPVSSTNETDCHDITEILLKYHKPNQPYRFTIIVIYFTLEYG